MKKILAVGLALVLTLASAGCGQRAVSDTPESSSNTATVEEDVTKQVVDNTKDNSGSDTGENSTSSTDRTSVGDTEPSAPQVAISDEPVESSDFEDSSEKRISPENINWEKVVYSIRDADGYELDIEIEQSPWILVSNTELIDAAWQNVANGNVLPQFNDWGFKQVNGQYAKELKYYNGTHQTTAFNISDMYYSVGTVTIRNKTEGWNIEPSNARNLNFYYGYCETIVKNIPPFMGRVFYSNSASDYAYCININSSMKGNTWGPVSFVMMTPEYYSPANPGGMTNLILNDEFALSYHTGNYSIKLISENQRIKLGIQTAESE